MATEAWTRARLAMSAPCDRVLAIRLAYMDAKGKKVEVGAQHGERWCTRYVARRAAAVEGSVRNDVAIGDGSESASDC